MEVTVVYARRRLTGLGLVVLGAWGGILPYVGPMFGYRMDQTPAWTWTTAHWELNLLPGIGALLAGLILLIRRRSFGLALGAASGAWFVLGPLFASMWLVDAQTRVASGGLSNVIEPLGYHYGLGLVILALCAWTAGRRVPTLPPGDYAPMTPGRHRHAREQETDKTTTADALLG